MGFPLSRAFAFRAGTQSGHTPFTNEADADALVY